VDQLEAAGILGAFEGSKGAPNNVLIPNEAGALHAHLNNAGLPQGQTVAEAL
jgi:hypothetical protein